MPLISVLIIYMGPVSIHVKSYMQEFLSVFIQKFLCY